MRSARILTAAFACIATTTARADVWIVDSSGNGEYTGIQEAVYAAASGDTLLVRPGSYAGFSITHKSLTLVTEADRSVTVVGTVLVRDLASWHAVNLSHLSWIGPGFPGLQVRDCEGPVRVRSCVVQDGAPGASVLRSADVAFVDCTFVGRDGGWGGTSGSNGVFVGDSRLALYGCLLTGGTGGDGLDGGSCFGGCTDGGAGGDGIRSTNSFVYAADCHFEGARGGAGGESSGYCECYDGKPGAAVRGFAGATTVLLDCSTRGAVAGSVEYLDGRARRIELPALVTELETHDLLCRGEPGDRVRIHAAPRGGFEYVAEERGVDLLGERFAGDVAATSGPAALGSLQASTVGAVIPASGILSIPLRASELPSGQQSALHHLQALFTDTAGRSTWSSVVVTEVFSSSAHLVDCLGTECDPPAVVYVDDDAPSDPGPGDTSVGDPAEDGSAEHPFDSILEALVSVATGGEIVVQDGLYSGQGNVDMGFLGRAVRLHSAHGPERCILDAQGAENVLRFEESEAPESIVEGFTLTGAASGGVFIDHSSPTLDRCRITGNATEYSGGGIRIHSGAPRITRCAVTDNTSVSYGGGILIGGSNTDPVLVRDCTIANNSAADVGGVASSADLVLLESSTIAGNSGVGVRLVGGSSGSDTLRARNCVVWGNSLGSFLVAGAGSRLFVDYCDVEGGEAGILGNGIHSWGVGNLDLDPRFVAPDLGDFHLALDSPCVDAGDPAFVPEPGGTDIDGDLRLLEGGVDMGSDESFVDCNGNGLPDVEEGLRAQSPLYSPFGSDYPATFLVTAPPLASGPVLLELWARADLGDQNERVTVRVNDVQLGSVFSAGGHDCPFYEERATLVLSAATFNAAVAGRDAVITLLPSSTVDAFDCDPPDSYLYARLTYDSDCNGNGLLDSCELAAGMAPDENGNGIPDSCE